MVLGFSGCGLVASWLWLLLLRFGVAASRFAQSGRREKSSGGSGVLEMWSHKVPTHLFFFRNDCANEQQPSILFARVRGHVGLQRNIFIYAGGRKGKSSGGAEHD